MACLQHVEVEDGGIGHHLAARARGVNRDQPLERVGFTHVARHFGPPCFELGLFGVAALG
jgi:hypothetical protein